MNTTDTTDSSHFALRDNGDRSPTDPTASSSVLDVRAWFEQSPWRIAAGWSVVAAALAAGQINRSGVVAPTTLVLLFVLVDPLWGSLWGLMTTPDSLPAVRRALARNRIWLPYLRPGSPAARLFGWEGPGVLPLFLRVALPGTLLALLIAFSLGPAAVWFSLLAILLSVAGWLQRQVELIPLPVLHSGVAVTLPWLLALVTLGVDLSGAAGSHHLALVALWTLHAWGGDYSLEDPHGRPGLAAMALAQVGMAALLIGVRAPLGLAVLSVLWLPTWLAVYRKQPLERIQFWWLAALLVSALALGQGS